MAITTALNFLALEPTGLSGWPISQMVLRKSGFLVGISLTMVSLNLN